MPLLNKISGFLRFVVDFILFTSSFTALCAVTLCMATERLFMGYVPVMFSPLHFFVIGCTLLVYNVHYLIKKSSVTLSDQYAWVQKHKHWNYSFLIIGLCLCSYFVFQLSQPVWQACIVLAAFSFAYSLPVLPFKNKHRLKDFGWLKIFLLAGIWTVVTAILPMLYWQQSIQAYPYEIVMRFIFLFILCLAFDIRDQQVDLEAGIFTLPNKIGLLNTYSLISVLVLLFICCSFAQYFRFSLPDRLAVNIISALLTLWAVHVVRKHPSDKNYLLLVDGQMLINALMLLLF
ncbi:MAG: UbiA family prenyltransferase [Bacteroidota bacterium]